MKNNDSGRKSGIRRVKKAGIIRESGMQKKKKSMDQGDSHPDRRTTPRAGRSVSDKAEKRKKTSTGKWDRLQGEYAGSGKFRKERRNIKSDHEKSFQTRGSGKNYPGRKVFAASEEIRLNRFLAHSGICSRREADEYIKAGLVTVNGEVVKEMGVKVRPDDIIKYNGETIRSERKVYILLNKPKDYITSLDDDKRRKTVKDLIRNACPERIYPVGRLDRNTTGVMLLTNDGELSAKLIHPRYNKKKVYHVSLDKNLKREDLQAIAKGITLDDGPVASDAISYVEGGRKNEIGIEIHSGKNRIVRRIFEHFGYQVIKLDRVYFAGLTKKNLPRGKWRFLTEKEVNTLKMNSYE